MLLIFCTPFPLGLGFLRWLIWSWWKVPPIQRMLLMTWLPWWFWVYSTVLYCWEVTLCCFTGRTSPLVCFWILSHSEYCQCVCYIQQHWQVYRVVAVFPIEIQIQVPFSLPIVVFLKCSLRTDMRCSAWCFPTYISHQNHQHRVRSISGTIWLSKAPESSNFGDNLYCLAVSLEVVA